MNIIDIILAIPLLWAAYNGFRKGIVLEIISICALLGAIYGSIYFSHFTASFLQKFNLKYIQIISFSITCILILVGIFWLGKVLDKVIKAAALGLVNRIAGSLFSLLKFGFILSCFLYIINNFDTDKKLITEQKQKDSFLYKPVSSIAPVVFPVLKENFEKLKK